MSAFHIQEQVSFRTMTPDGPFSGTGQVVKIFPAGPSYWLHVRQQDGSVRMLYEATTQISPLVPMAA
jgi:hypothetical protein